MKRIELNVRAAELECYETVVKNLKSTLPSLIMWYDDSQLE